MKRSFVLLLLLASLGLSAGNGKTFPSVCAVSGLTSLSADSTDLLIPNVFTPNNDGINDVFKISGGNLKSMDCLIFDRWGVKLWELKSPLETWDGHNLTGIACNSGVYFYVLTATGVNGTSYSKSGYFELLR